MVFKYLLQHRIAFCERLRDQLDARGVELRLKVLPNSTGPDAYAAGVIRLLRDDAGMARLRAGCERSSTVYTAEEMAQRWAEGLVQTLAA